METKLFFRDNLKGIERYDSYIATAISRIGRLHRDSEFGKMMAPILELSPTQIISYGTFDTLAMRDYDALLALDHDSVLGHMAFQQHQRTTLDWEMFNVSIDNNFQGQGFCHYLARELIASARKYGVNRIRMGAGGHDVTKKINAQLSADSSNLKIKVDLASHWISLTQ